MKKVLYIESSRFLRLALEKVAKQQEFYVHTLDEGRDCLYLIKDWRPDVIFFDLSSVLKYEDEFNAWAQSSFCAQIPFVATGTPQERARLGEWGGKIRLIQKPLDPMALKDLLFPA